MISEWAANAALAEAGAPTLPDQDFGLAFPAESLFSELRILDI